MPSTSKAQARLMRAVAHGWHKPGGGGPSKAVAQEFAAADQAKHFKEGGMRKMRVTRPTPPRLPKALAGVSAPPPNMPAGPVAGAGTGGPPMGPGMKKGGMHKMAQGGVVPKTVKPPKDETPEKKWKIKGQEKDKHGEKIAMRSGGSVKKFSGGGMTRGDGIAERGHTKGKIF